MNCFSLFRFPHLLPSNVVREAVALLSRRLERKTYDTNTIYAIPKLAKQLKQYCLRTRGTRNKLKEEVSLRMLTVRKAGDVTKMNNNKSW
jgi:hypothetical protein